MNGDILLSGTVDRRQRDIIYTIYILASFVYFAPLFLRGMTMAGCSDFLFSKAVLHFVIHKNILAGSFGDWWPHLMGGNVGVLEQAASVDGLFSLEQWLLLFVSDATFYMWFTFIQFLFVAGTGAVFFEFFRIELNSTFWAAAAALVVQVGGVTVNLLTYGDSVSVQFFGGVVLYLFWTLEKRSWAANFFWITLLLAICIGAAIIHFGAHMALAVGFFVLYRIACQPNFKVRLRSGCLFGGATLVALMMVSARLIPMALELGGSYRGVQYNHPGAGVLDLSFLGLRLIAPDIFGIYFEQSKQLFNFFSNQFTGGVHIQWAAPQFYGVVVLLLGLGALVAVKNRRATFWAAYAVVALGAAMYREPFQALTYGVFQAYFHSVARHLLVPVAVAAAFGWVGRSLCESQIDGRKALAVALLTGVIALAFGLTFWMVVNRGHPMTPYLNPSTIRYILLAIAFVVVIAAVFRPPIPVGRPWFWESLVWILLVVAMAAIVYLNARFSGSAPTGFLASEIVSTRWAATSVIGLLFALILALRARGGKLHAGDRFSWIVGIGVAVFCGYFLLTVDLPDRVQNFQFGMRGTFVLAGLAAVKFAIAMAVLLVLMVPYAKTSAPWGLRECAVVFVAIVAELVPAAKAHSFVAYTPFLEGPIYPSLPPPLGKDGNPVTLDNVNGRVRLANLVLRIPIATYRWGHQRGAEPLVNSYAVYDVRTFYGYLNTGARRFMELANAISPKEAPFRGKPYLPPNMNEELSGRFLDLAAVRYTYDVDFDGVRERPQALSRFMLFESYVIIRNDKDTLARLKAPKFDPWAQVILADTLPRHLSGRTDVTRRLVAKEKNTDHIMVPVAAERPSIVLFNDNYHDGWQAYIGGTELQVYRANHAFMAVQVPPGKHVVEFRFNPRSTAIGRYVTSGGFAVLLWATGLLYWRRRDFDAPQTISEA